VFAPPHYKTQLPQNNNGAINAPLLKKAVQKKFCMLI
jgi:hypothetical protein